MSFYKYLMFAFLLIPISIDAQELPVDEKVRMGQLENGLTYYIRENGTPENRAELRLVVNAGSIQETDEQQGLAHFAEHMLFNGTKNFKKNELIDFFELTGMKFGAHVNAYTSFDETVYMLKPRTDDEDIFEKSFQVLEDWAHQASFDGEEIDKERGVVIEEWRLRLGPENRMMAEYLPTLFYDSRYAERLPIGKKDILENFEHESLRDFYRDWYRPDLMAIIAVGDFDAEEVEEKIKAHFSHIENIENAPKRQDYYVPIHPDTKVKVVTDPEASFSHVRVYYKHPEKEMNTVEDYQKFITYNLYRAMMSNRFDELRQKADPPFVYAGAGYGSLTRNSDAFTTSAMVSDKNIIRGFQTILEENARVLQHGFTQSELDRAKKDLLKNIKSKYNEKEKMKSASLASEYINNFLDDEPIPGITYEFQFHEKFLPTIQLEEVNKLAGKWITPQNATIIITAPEKDGVIIPSEEEVLNLYSQTILKKVAAYEETGTDGTLLEIRPQGSQIVSKKNIKEAGVVEVTFDNGARVVMKPTDFKNDEILFSASSPGGHSIYDDEDYYSALYADAIINESGLADMDKISLKKALAGKDLRLSPYIGELHEGFSGQASPADIETMLKLLYLYFTEPRMDKEAFSAFIQKQTMIYGNLDANPRYYFSKQVQKTLTQDHLRHGFPESENLEKIDPEKVYEIFKDRFNDAGDFTFFFVGNFSVEDIMPLIESYIGGLPSDRRDENWVDRNIEYPEGKIEVAVHKGTEDQSLVNMTFTGPFEYNYDNRLQLNMLTDVLAIKLREQMREEQGGVYGVGIYAQPSEYPEEEYAITIRFGCSPDNVEELVETIKKEIKTLQEEGAEEMDVNKVQETNIRSRETDIKENKFWIKALSNYYEHGEDVTALMNYEEKVKSVNSADIQEAARKYFDLDEYVLVVLYPEELED